MHFCDGLAAPCMGGGAWVGAGAWVSAGWVGGGVAYLHLSVTSLLVGCCMKWIWFVFFGLLPE